MKLKRILAAFLTAAMLCTMLVAVPAGAASATGGFTDIPDAATATAAETLRLLGIVSGDGGGAYYPNNTLTRAQFCKMAVTAIGKSAEADAQMNRTIFKDVLGDHWARGYINFAASYVVGANAEGKGGDPLMGGVGNGTFQPDKVITYAEVVTIMMRILNYSSTDLTSGANWYDGPIATARAIGLSDGVTLNHYDAISRGQTAILFENMLFTPAKDGKEPYLTTNLGGKIVKEAVILSLDATTDDGATGAIRITGEAPAYKTEHAPFDKTLEGCRAELVLDKNDKVIAIQPSTVGSQKTVSIITAEATYVTVAGGEKVEVTQSTPVYQNGKTLTYKDVYVNIKASTVAVFHYAAGGKLEYVFLPSSSEAAETAAVALATGGNPFSALVGKDSDYRIIKNGLPASISDVRQYDVGTYDKTTKTLYVSDLRLTGVYENVSPSPVTPLSVSMMGASFPVMSVAYDDFSRFKIGDVITLLLTADGQVAGVVSPSEAKSTTVAMVEKVTDTFFTGSLLSDLRDASGKPVLLSGNLNMTKAAAAKLVGQLVTVSSSKIGQVNLTRLTSSGAPGALDVAARKMGTAPLAENVRLYERVGAGAPQPIAYSQLTRATVPTSKISYVSMDYAGRVSVIIFDDAVGDQYIYGVAEKGNDAYSGSGELTAVNPTIRVISGEGKKSDDLICSATIKDGTFIGLSVSLETIGGTNKIAGWLELKSIQKVSRSAFQIDSEPVLDALDNVLPIPIGTVTAGGMILPIAGNVACYNKTTKKWFDSLNDARAYSDSLTVYYDKAPQEGGKVRLVVVE